MPIQGRNLLKMEVPMEIKIQSIHFDTTEKLQAFITKKVETALNKTTSISVVVPGTTLFVEKTFDTFEEGVDECVDAMKVQLTKFKEKQRKR